MSTEGAQVLVAFSPFSLESPTLDETQKAPGQLEDGWASGTCGMHVKMLKDALFGDYPL